MTKKSFAFPKKHNMPFYYVSASDGTNVVKVSYFPHMFPREAFRQEDRFKK